MTRLLLRKLRDINHWNSEGILFELVCQWRMKLGMSEATRGYEVEIYKMSTKTQIRYDIYLSTRL